MASQKHEFKVTMTCEGCSGAVTRVLKRLEGVETIDIDMAKQTVHVQSTLPSDKLLETIKKTGKECSYVGVV
ncbi:copper transport protein ATOX1-like [Corticium candelabrum]|uniref:copper transport protein ATOX1-like n=1 Tax=Corticium candelabrum TaxID=121492 RepID=UPI002E26307C|nr:copper transport protein ATOX1-like [Corticium candelabrum]